MSKNSKAFILGIVGSFFFAYTFIFNRSMNLSGGYWIYSAVLRYFFTLPMLFCLLCNKGKWRPVIADIRKKPVQWIVWSTVGFGLFYLPLTAASLYAESWFTCAMWQVTIVCGVFLTPLFGKKIPVRNLCCSFLILAGILLMQISNLINGSSAGMLAAFLLILVAAFSYPLGNRKTMAMCDQELNTIQRVFGMTLCSMPFWIIWGIIAFAKAGPPDSLQCIQCFAVAMFSGVIATIFFFKATDMVRNDARMLAIVESTQCGEVVFSLLLGIIAIKDAAPTLLSWIGIGIIITGMILTNIVKKESNKKEP